MPAHNTETEVKVYYADLAQVAQRLEHAGAALVSPRVFERNIRYENEAHTLSPQGIAVRLRQDSRTRLTYKAPGNVTNGIISRYEAEVEVGDFDTMHLILQHLGYQPYMAYEKYRTTYTLHEAEIVLDEMPYGNFVEIEGDTATISAILQQLELDALPRQTQSYTRLFDTLRNKLALPFTDLTFTNFEGIDIPSEMLSSAPDENQA